MSPGLKGRASGSEQLPEPLGVDADDRQDVPQVPLAMSRPAWTGTTTVRPSGWRITRWLPLILTTVKPARSSALTTFTPGTAGKDSSIRRRLGSASAHPEDQPRRAILPARPAGRQPRLPPSDRRPPPPRPSAAVRRHTRRRFVLFYDVGRWTMRVTTPILPYQERSTDRRRVDSASRIIADAQPRVWSARLVQPDRLGEHDMPPAISTQRRRAGDELRGISGCSKASNWITTGQRGTSI